MEYCKWLSTHEPISNHLLLCTFINGFQYKAKLLTPLPPPPNKTNLPDTNIDLLRWSGRSINWFLSWIFILLQFRKAPSSTADPGPAVAIIASRLANCGWQVAETDIFLEEFPNGGGHFLSETMVLNKWLNFSCCKMCIHVYLSKCFNCTSFLINKCIVNGNFSCFNYLNLQSCGHH